MRVRETERLWMRLEERVANASLPERVLPVLFDAAMGLRVRNATYRASLEESGEEEISDQTASRDLQRLVQAGLLEPRGQKRGRLYAGSPDLRSIRQRIINARDPRNNTDPFADTAG